MKPQVLVLILFATSLASAQAPSAAPKSLNNIEGLGLRTHGGGEAGPQYYTSQKVGIRILLPPGWVFLAEQKASFAQRAMVVLGQPGTPVTVSLTRRFLAASPQLYWRLWERDLIEASGDYRRLSEQKVTRGGLEGTKILFDTRILNVKYRSLVEIFSAREEHFLIAAQAPEEVFDRYVDTFTQMLNSVQFPGLEKSSSATDLTPPVQGELGNATARINLGNAFAGQGRLDEAVAQYREATRLDPNDALAHIFLGSALYRQGDLKVATAEYREAIRINPNSGLAHTMMVLALADQGKLDEAIAEGRQAIRLSPNFAAAHNDLGFALYRQRKLDEAIAEFREAIRLNPNSVTAHVNLGNALDDSGDHEGAMAEYREAIRLNPFSAGAHRNVGVIYYRQGDLQRAEVKFRQAVELDPDYLNARVALAKVLLTTLVTRDRKSVV